MFQSGKPEGPIKELRWRASFEGKGTPQSPLSLTLLKVYKRLRGWRFLPPTPFPMESRNRYHWERFFALHPTPSTHLHMYPWHWRRALDKRVRKKPASHSQTHY